VLLGNVAYRSGQKFNWDGEKMTSDNAAANAFLTKEYRSGWEIA